MKIPIYLSNCVCACFRFFLCEALCLVVVVGNIYFTDLFLGGTFLKYGTEVINFPDMDPEHRVDPMTRIFPRVTKCTFRSVKVVVEVEVLLLVVVVVGFCEAIYTYILILSNHNSSIKAAPRAASNSAH